MTLIFVLQSRLPLWAAHPPNCAQITPIIRFRLMRSIRQAASTKSPYMWYRPSIELLHRTFCHIDIWLYAHICTNIKPPIKHNPPFAIYYIISSDVKAYITAQQIIKTPTPPTQPTRADQTIIYTHISACALIDSRSIVMARANSCELYGLISSILSAPCWTVQSR